VSTTDCKHVIACKYGSNKAFTDCRENSLIQIPLKQKNKGATYKDYEERKGGYVSFSIYFKKQQKNSLNRDDLYNLSLSAASVSYNAIGQKEIDEKLDNSIQGEYAWINEGGVTRTLISPIDGGIL
jgi:hypothetical protein